MPWMPGIPHDQGTQPQGTIRPLGVVAHRTYGSWNGDYSVGAGSKPPVGFHFLVGKADGWVQFYDTTTRCAHAGTNANGNDISIGLEVEGRNDEPMTAWQVDRVRDIVSWLKATHDIALSYRFSTAHDLRADYGYIPHSAVAGADHSDYWTVDDWNRIVDGAGSTAPAAHRRKDGDMLVTRNTQEIYLLSGGRLVYIYDPNALPGLIHILGQPCLVDEHTWASMVTAYGEPS